MLAPAALSQRLEEAARQYAGSQTLEQRARLGTGGRFDVVAAEYLHVTLYEVLAEFLGLPPRAEGLDHPAAAASHVIADCLDWNFYVQVAERRLPRLHMQIVGVDQRSIYVEQGGADQPATI
jgi:hypothetical protein